MDVGTVDSYQGQERELILLSCVRSTSSGKIGFLKDSNRPNVVLTHVKQFLIVVGNSNSLSRSPECKSEIFSWKHLVMKKAYK